MTTTSPLSFVASISQGEGDNSFVFSNNIQELDSIRPDQSENIKFNRRKSN